MADDADRTTDRMEREDNLRRMLPKPGPELVWIGRCYNCDAELPDPLRFCDADCREDHEYRKRQAQRTRGQ